MNAKETLAIVLGVASPVLGADDGRLSLSRAWQPAEDAIGGEVSATLDEGRPARLRFEDRAEWRLGFVAGAAVDLEEDDSATDTHAAFVAEFKLAPRWDLLVQLDTYYSNQAGDNGFGIGPSFGFRWHFYETGRVTLFADAGVGFAGFVEETPDGGTRFNFTPRAGGGLTYRLTDDGVRLVAGVRWHHISNAQISGDDDNPDRDGVMGYAGVSFPF